MKCGITKEKMYCITCKQVVDGTSGICPNCGAAI
jgi:RNA polymerase subunit RPABC4/transcription elongation factor Spt4